MAERVLVIRQMPWHGRTRGGYGIPPARKPVGSASGPHPDRPGNHRSWDCPPPEPRSAVTKKLLRVLGLMLVFLRVCHAEAVVSLVGTDEHGRHQACIGEPYHLADGMDLRPRRPSGGYYGDRVGGPRRRGGRHRRRGRGGPGSAECPARRSGGYRFAEGRVLACGEYGPSGPMVPVVTLGDRDDQPRVVHAHRRTPGSLHPRRRPPGRRGEVRHAQLHALAVRRTRPVTPGTAPRPADRPRG